NITKTAVFASYLIRVIPSKMYSSQYIKLFLESNFYWEQLHAKSQGTGQPNVNATSLGNLVLPLPPVVEQERIVTKVNELFKQCDQLFKVFINKQTRSEVLNRSIFARLDDYMNPSYSEDLRFLIKNINYLCNDKENINQLRKSLLSLALQGKLVEQDSTCEPASILLEKVKEEKERLIREKKIKKEKLLPQITDEEKPFELPHRWEWVRLQDISHLITKGSSPKWQGVEYTENPDDVLFITSENVGNFNLILKKKKYVQKRFNEIEPRSILQKGDLLMNIVGASIGRTAIFNIEACANINQAVCLIRPTGMVIKEYLLLFFNSQLCISYMYDNQVDSARANLSMG
ncbi:restriction endonuclease subunit S, partial [Priestia megaterium]